MPRLISRRWARASSRASAIPVYGNSPSAMRGRSPRHRNRKSQRFVPVSPTRRMSAATAGSAISNFSPVGPSADSCAADNLAETRVLRGIALTSYDRILWTHLWTHCRATPRNVRRPVTTPGTSIQQRSKAMHRHSEISMYALKPLFFKEFSSQPDAFCCVELRTCYDAGPHSIPAGPARGMAQSGSASALGAEGRGFESLCPDHIQKRAGNLETSSYIIARSRRRLRNRARPGSDANGAIST
jgi:hypothetical protein